MSRSFGDKVIASIEALQRQKICAGLMRDVLQRQVIELDGFAHKARANDNFIHAQIFSDMADAGRRAIKAWEESPAPEWTKDVVIPQKQE
jgi:hypothetical protein